MHQSLRLQSVSKEARVQGTIVISIGANIGSWHMDYGKWKFFKNDITTLFDNIFFFGEGEGSFNKKYGKEIEDAYTIIGTTSKTKEELEEQVSKLAARYQQDHIAVVYGESVLVTGKR